MNFKSLNFLIDIEKLFPLAQNFPKPNLMWSSLFKVKTSEQDIISLLTPYIK